MSSDENIVKIRIKNSITYSSIIFLIFIYWFFYSSFNNISILFIICVFIFFIIFAKFITERKNGFTRKEKIFYILLFVIPFSLFANAILFYNTSITIFIPFNELVGLYYNFNIVLFLIYFSIIMLKLVGIKIYFSKNIKFLEEGGGDEIFQFFTQNVNYKKIIILIIFFPLVAFIEELIYRTLLISVLTYYFHWEYFISIIFISIIFGLVHFSTSQNWGHVMSTLISSVIYSLALIQLGIVFPWIFHLSTNLFVLLFYHQSKKRLNFKE
ncbi:MAG: type II CAAX prenyl endopeptidase Rce1 family protein [Candidatus Odinarchaeota archaeon]